MAFLKGHKETVETREKRLAASKIALNSPEIKRKMSLVHSGEKNGMYGKHHSEETKKKLALAHILRPREYPFKKGHIAWNKGKPYPHLPHGEKHFRWKGGVSSKQEILRGSPQYVAWRKEVFKRDNYMCQFCGVRGSVDLNAHHIRPFALFPALRFDVTNGITLCEDCHITIPRNLGTPTLTQISGTFTKL